MYKVLIADDHQTDRERLVELLDRLKPEGFHVCGAYPDGRTALEGAEICRPDILVTDIEMPGMNGFQLAKAVRALHPDVKIVFCSLFSEFEYARQALYLDGYGYVLKPPDPDEFKACLLRVAGVLEAKEAQDRQQTSMRLLLDENRPFLVENLIKQIIQHRVQDEALIWERLTCLGADVQKGTYIMILLEIDDYQSLSGRLGAERREWLGVGVRERIRQGLKGDFGSAIMHPDEGHVQVLLSKSGTDRDGRWHQEMGRTLETIIAGFEATDISMTAAMSTSAVCLDAIPDLNEQCWYAIRQKFVHGKGRVYYQDELPECLPVKSQDFNAMLREIRHLINAGTPYHIHQYMRVLEKDMFVNQPEARNACFMIIMIVQMVVHEQKETMEAIFGTETILWEKLLRFETILDTKNWLTNTLLSVQGHFANRVKGREESIVRRAKGIITSSALSGLSLESVAASLHYSPRYLNRVFKQVTDETVSECILGLRMEKAKALLTEPGIRMQDIAEHLGYSHSSYFNIVFRKHVGVSPKEYRERCI